MSVDVIPYIKWGDYTSKDKDNPDILEIKVSDFDKFETEYSINVQILLKTENELEYRILPIKSHTSRNASLLKLWDDGIRRKKIKKDSRFKIKTWIGKSTKSDYPIRRFSMEF